MIRIYDAAPTYVGEIRKRFNKEFCDGILTETEHTELNNIYNRILELAFECKNRKQGAKNDS